MQIAMIADLHGNLPATMALDADLKKRGIRHIYCLGDIIGKGPSSAETMDWALEHCEVILMGNWDSGIGFKEFPADEFYYNQLGDRRMKILRELPLEYHTMLSGRKTRLFHGRPLMDKALQIYSDLSALEPFFLPDWDVVGYGDCHRQGMRVLGHKGMLFNTGSVGNSIGVPMVQYAILQCGDSKEDPLDITMVSLPYDQDQAVRDALAAEKQGLVNAQAYIREVKTGVYSR